jgi:16S rRNA (adenine1518-N6/adenine1519-N6)-dimethyltransferase
MQTKQQIQQLLASAGVQPNKRLGQHFLIDLNLMRLLVDAANITKNDTVLEVGCGTGSLTQALTDCAATVIAVEFDRTLTEIAQKQLTRAKNVEILQTDVLENKNTISHNVIEAIRLARKKHAGRFLLVANLPYNVAGPLIHNLITSSTPADGMYVTVQKEVAQRITAQLGSNDYGTLSIFAAATGKVKIIRTLKPTVFWPQPQVDSAMVSFIRNEEKARHIRSIELFSTVVNLFMGHRRKMLKACTKFALGKLSDIRNWTDIFEHSFTNPHYRPDQLSPENYIAIANLCYEYLNQK